MKKKLEKQEIENQNLQFQLQQMNDEHELLYEKLKAKEVELNELNKLYMELLENQTER